MFDTHRFSILALVVLVWLGAPAFAVAEHRLAEQRVVELHEQALEAYANMEMDRADELLQRALQVIRRSGLSGPAVARVHVTYATVLILGHGRLADGREHLVAAARENPEVRPDPLLSTPLLDQVWSDVLAEVQPTSPDGQPDGPPDGPRDGPPDGPRDGPPDDVAPTFGRGRIVHDPVREQLEGHAIPIYVELEQVRDVERVLLAYRTPGMGSFLTLDMAEHGDGYAARVPCHRVRPPLVEYFVTVRSGADQEVTGAGSEDDPIRVDVTEDDLLGPPPSLPGEPPEPPCSEDDRDQDEGTPLHQRNRLFYAEAQIGTGAGIPFGSTTRQCPAGSDRVSVSPSLSWTEMLVMPEIGFYIRPQISLGVRVRLQVAGITFQDPEPYTRGWVEWGVLLRARWFFIPDDPIRVYAHFGAGYATVAHRVVLEVSPTSTPVCGAVHYKIGGAGVAAVGAGLLFNVVRNFAIGGELGISVFFPDAALQGDLTFVLEASF